MSNYCKHIIHFIIYLIIFSISGHTKSLENDYLTIESIDPPSGFQRLKISSDSFAAWLRNLPLKNPNAPVLDYKGNIFKNTEDTTVAAVINWDIRGKRLEQCMDIIIRFYAEYLWKNNQTDQLTLPLPGGYWLDWHSWKNGLRPLFKGIDVFMQSVAESDSSKNNYNKYLRTVFAESGTQQFYYDYKSIKRKDIQIGDFIVKKGVKGHAILIMDLAVNPEGKMAALIGQGDTPACEFYLLNYSKENPWFPLNFEKNVLTLPIKKKMTWNGLRRFQIINSKKFLNN